MKAAVAHMTKVVSTNDHGLPVALCVACIALRVGVARCDSLVALGGSPRVTRTAICSLERSLRAPGDASSEHRAESERLPCASAAPNLQDPGGELVELRSPQGADAVGDARHRNAAGLGLMHGPCNRFAAGSTHLSIPVDDDALAAERILAERIVAGFVVLRLLVEVVEQGAVNLRVQ